MTPDTQQPPAPIRLFVSGACPGLGETRDAIAAHDGIELVGASSDAIKAGPKYATSGAQVVLHAVGSADASPKAEMGTIRQFTQAPVVLLTTQSGTHFAQAAIEAGVSDVVLLPQSADNLAFTITKALSMGALLAQRIGDIPTGRRAGTSCHVITIFSPKGGAGKTMLASNLGTHYAQRLKRRSLLIDLDLQFGDVAITLGLDPKQTLLDLMMAHGELDQDKVSGLVTQHGSGLHVLPAPTRPEDADLVTEDRLGNLLTIARQAYDVVVIDVPASFNAQVLQALDRTDTLLLMCSLDIPSVKSVKVALKTLELLHFPQERIRVVLNRSDSKVGLKHSEIEHVLERRIDFNIPSNRVVPLSVNRGIPVVTTDPRSDVARALHRLSIELVPEVRAAHPGEKDAVQSKLGFADRRRLRRAERAAAREEREQMQLEPPVAPPSTVDQQAA